MRTAIARRLCAVVDESATIGHRPVYTEIVHRAHDAGLHGASVFRGIEGFGRSGRVHTTRLLNLSERLPVLVVIVDDPAAIERFVDDNAALLAEALLTVEDVEVVLR